MYRGDQLGAPHYAQGPAFLGTQGPRLPGHNFSFESSPSRAEKSPYDKVSGILIEFPCVLVDFLGVRVYVLL